jgi:hypothetical protein
MRRAATSDVPRGALWCAGGIVAGADPLPAVIVRLVEAAAGWIDWGEVSESVTHAPTAIGAASFLVGVLTGSPPSWLAPPTMRGERLSGKAHTCQPGRTESVHAVP